MQAYAKHTQNHRQSPVEFLADRDKNVVLGENVHPLPSHPQIIVNVQNVCAACICPLFMPLVLAANPLTIQCLMPNNSSSSFTLTAVLHSQL